MIEQDYTIQTYMQEIKPIVDEVYSHDSVVKKMERNLDQLQEETRRCDDNLSIYLCWQDNIGRELHQHYSHQDLLEFHGQPHGTIIQTGTYYSILSEEEHVVDFHFCDHRVYTPITSRHTTHQCLKC